MGLFNQFPFTNFHEMNLDWLVNNMKNANDYIKTNKTEISDIQNKSNAMEAAINENKNRIDSDEDRISTLEQSGSATIPNVVNVQDFGAYGDALIYFSEDNTYYKDYNKTPCHDDTDAINNALNYAKLHNIGTIYFPDGAYMYKGRITIDISKTRFIGENNSALVSSGLTDGAFITLTSPTQLLQYNYSKSPLDKINIWGSYFNGETYAKVSGISFDLSSVPCHSMFENISILRFYYGVSGKQLYKTSWINCSIIACYFGFYMETASYVPLYFINCFFECNNCAIFGNSGGYNQTNFISCAFEYNRAAISYIGFVNFYGCRFEYDYRSAINTETLQSVTQISWGDGGTPASNIIMDNCQFLDIPNYPENVKDWIKNPIVKSDRQGELISISSSRASCFMNDCSFALTTPASPLGNYYISGNATILRGCKVSGYTSATFINTPATPAYENVWYL